MVLDSRPDFPAQVASIRNRDSSNRDTDSVFDTNIAPARQRGVFFERYRSRRERLHVLQCYKLMEYHY